MLAGAAESDKSPTADLVQNLTERIQALETYVLAQQEIYPICDAEGRTVRLEVPETSGYNYKAPRSLRKKSLRYPS